MNHRILSLVVSLAILLPAAAAAQDRPAATMPAFTSNRELMAYLLRAHGLKAIANETGAWRIVPDEETVPDAASLPQGSGTISRLRRKLL